MKEMSKIALTRLYPNAFDPDNYSTLNLIKWNARYADKITPISMSLKHKAAAEITQKLGRPIEKIKLTELVKDSPTGESRPRDLVDLHNLKFVQGGLGALLKTKVESLVTNGAEFTTDMWQEFVNVHDMRSTEKLDIPITAAKDFKVYDGYQSGASRQDSGGNVEKVSLDVSQDDKIKYMEIPIKESDIRFKKWNYIEDTLSKAGDQMATFVLGQVVRAIRDAAITTAFVTDLYNTFVLTRRDRKKAGFPPKSVIVAPDEEAVLLNISNFIDANKLDRTGEIVRTGQIGRILDNKVYAPVYDVIDTDLAHILVFDPDKALHMGMALDITIANWDEPLRGLSHSILTMQYDLKAGTSGAAGKGAVV